jgi:hypothetical protein
MKFQTVFKSKSRDMSHAIDQISANFYLQSLHLCFPKTMSAARDFLLIAPFFTIDG